MKQIWELKAQMIQIKNTTTNENKNNSDNEVSFKFDKNDISSTLHMRISMVVLVNTKKQTL